MPAIGLLRRCCPRLSSRVVFVLDVADDLLQDVLDGDEARDAAVLVDDDGDVVAGLTGTPSAAR
jgi:hypothetical protein